MERRVYADFNATTPCSTDHLDAVVAMLKEADGNPSSIHYFGRETKVRIEAAREKLAALLGCDPIEMIFTSGATESNNMAIQGLVQIRRGSRPALKPHVVITGGEHSSVRVTARLLAERGLCDVSVAPLMPSGIVNTSALLDAIEDRTVLVSVIHGNNEVGAINDVMSIAAEVKDRNPDIHFHADSVQALGKLDLTGIGASQVDSVAISSHKVGGLKGIGGLYLRRGLEMGALIAGGGQERSRRSGTENIAGIYSFGLRADDLLANPGWLEHCGELRRVLVAEIEALPGGKIVGEPETTLSTTVNFHIENVPGDEILLNLDLAGIAASAGSACSSGVARPSSVISAMGYSEWVALNSIRISFGPTTTAADVDLISKVLREVVAG